MMTLATAQAAWDNAMPPEDPHDCKEDGHLFVVVRQTSMGVAYRCTECGAKDCDVWGD